MTRRSLRSLLERPVRLNGIELGRVVDALVDVEALRVVGFDVSCGDGQRRFLPLGAARIASGALEIDTPLVLLDEEDQPFYRRRGSMFGDLCRPTVAGGDVAAGALLDLLLGDGGAVVAAVVDAGGARSEVPVADAFVLGRAAREPAA